MTWYSQLRVQMPPTIEACLLDLDDTLYDRSDALSRVTAILYQTESAINSSATRVEVTEAVLAWDRISPGDVSRDQARRALFERIIASWPGISRSADHLVEWYKHEILESIELRNGTRCFLKALEHYAIPWAIVSNGGPLQFAKISALDLQVAPTAVVLSEEVGFRKPDPRIF